MGPIFIAEGFDRLADLGDDVGIVSVNGREAWIPIHELVEPQDQLDGRREAHYQADQIQPVRLDVVYAEKADEVK